MTVSNETVIVPRRREDIFEPNGDPTHRFIRWMELVTGTTNVAVVDIDNSKDNITSSSSRVSRNAARINSLELRQFEIVNTTASVATESYQIIICKNTGAIDVTLDTQAVADDEVHIKRRNAVVTVKGTIDGLTDKIINVQNYSMHLVFDGTDWSEI